MKPFHKRVLLMLAVSLICAALTANATYDSRTSIAAVAEYAPDVAQGIVFDDWLEETHSGFHGDGETLIRFDVTDPSVFDAFSPPPFESTITADGADGSTSYSISLTTLDSDMPDPSTAYWMIDVHGPDSAPWNNICVGLYYPDDQTFYWYESDI